MKQYFCDCLNVIINVRESREVPGSSMVYSSSTSNSFDFDREDDKDVNADTFFTNKLLDVQLGISGIEVVILLLFYTVTPNYGIYITNNRPSFIARYI